MSKPTPTKEDLEDLKVAGQMQDLINTDGWKIYQKILQKHIDEKILDLLQPLFPVRAPDGTVLSLDGVSHVLVAEGAKGAILGLRLALSLPSGIVSGAEQIRAKFNKSDAEVGT